MRSSRERADERGGIIRIYTKKKPLGLSGNVGTSVGTYKPSYNFISPNAALYFGKESWNLYGTYNYDRSTSGSESTTSSIYPDGSRYSNSGEGRYRDQSHSFRVGSSVFPSKRHQLNVELNGSFATTPKGAISRDNFVNYDKDGTTTKAGDFTSDYDLNTKLLTSVLNYKYNIDDKGGYLRFIGSYTHHSSNSDNNMLTNYSKEYSERSPLAELDHSSARANSYDLQGDFSKTLRTWDLNAGLSFTSTHRNSLLDVWQNDSRQSYSKWISDERISAGYAELSRSFKNGMYLLLSMRVENTDMKGDVSESDGDQVKKNYTDFIPFVYFSGRLGKVRYVAAYTRMLYRPSFRLMTNYSNRISDWLLDIGNPNIKREITDIAQLQFFRSAHTLVLTYSRTDDPITQVFEMKDGLTYHSNQNLGYNEYFSLNYGYNKKLFKWWLLKANLTGRYDHLPECYIKKSIWTGQGSLTNKFSFPIGDFSLSVRGKTPYISGISRWKGYWGCDFEYNYFGKNWTLTFAIDDVFDSQKSKVWNYSPAVDYTSWSKKTSRMFRIGFTYTFSTKAKVSKDKARYSKAIQNRL